jgi:hypothetical protein
MTVLQIICDHLVKTPLRAAQWLWRYYMYKYKEYQYYVHMYK